MAQGSFLTFLMFLCVLGGGEDGSLGRKGSSRRKNPSPHRMVKMVSVAQEVELELSQVVRTLFRDRRGFSII